MTKEQALIDHLAEMSDRPASPDQSRLSFHIARELELFPTAHPDDYSDEFDALCERLNFDSEELQLLVASKSEKSNIPVEMSA